MAYTPTLPRFQPLGKLCGGSPTIGLPVPAVPAVAHELWKFVNEGIPPFETWPDSLREVCAERAAIKEFDGGNSREAAEEQARSETWKQWQAWSNENR